MPKLTSVHHLALTVTDVERSVPWYARVLDLEESHRREDPETGVHKVVLRSAGDGFSVVLVQHPEVSPNDQRAVPIGRDGGATTPQGRRRGGVTRGVLDRGLFGGSGVGGHGGQGVRHASTLPGAAARQSPGPTGQPSG